MRGASGVDNWSTCRDGDQVWDVAWPDVWTPELGFAPSYLRAKPTPDGQLRLLCYHLLIAAQSFGFYFHTGQPENGRWLRDIVGRSRGASAPIAQSSRANLTPVERSASSRLRRCASGIRPPSPLISTPFRNQFPGWRVS